MSVDTDIDLSILEELDFPEPCCIERPPCAAAAPWKREARCGTPGCPDQTLRFCDQHAGILRAAEALAGPAGICTWCKLTRLEVTWIRV